MVLLGFIASIIMYVGMVYISYEFPTTKYKVINICIPQLIIALFFSLSLTMWNGIRSAELEANNIQNYAMINYLIHVHSFIFVFILLAIPFLMNNLKKHQNNK